MKTVIFNFSLSFIVLLTMNTRAGDIRHDRKKEDCVRYANQSQFDCTGRVLIDMKPAGSCVLINAKWILTAAHLFQDNINPDAYTITLSKDTVRVEKIVLHPASSYQSLDSNIDLALIKLSSSIDDVKPANLYRGKNELGKEASLIGYGVFGNALDADMDTTNTLRIGGTNMIDQIGDSITSIETGFSIHKLLIDFDSPIDSSKNRIGSATPLDLEYMGSGGDSGCGCFIQENGNWYLAGIYVQSVYSISSDFAKYGTYGTVGCAERVSDFKDWIDKITHN